MISIIIPTYKENLDPLAISKIFNELGYEPEIIISPDENPHIGKGHAIKQGLRQATGKYILIMDADMQVHPSSIIPFFKLLDLYNADVIIGNKHHLWSINEYTLSRRIISNGYHFLVKTLFDMHLRDTQCGFKLFKREILMKIIDKILENRYAFDLEVLIALRDNCIMVIDAPVYVRKQENSGSVSLKNIWFVFFDTLRIWFRRQKGWYKIG